MGGDRQALLDRLSTLAAGGEAQGIVRGFAGADRAPIFLFPGQGAQSAQMAVELLDSSPAFAAHVAACEEALEPHVQWSLGEVLRDPEGAWLDRLDIVQPALFAVMVSLAKLWRECGVEPAAVVGHSQGEIAAAHIAGGLSLEDAALVIAERGKAMARIAGKGGMLSVSLSPEQLAPRLEPYGERVSLAAINGPASLVVSGEPEALSELLEGCEGDDVRAQRIAVDYAAHSAQIEALEGELLEAFASISPRSGDIPLHSTVTGELLDTAEQDGAYWYRNLRQTVRLEPVLRSLLEQGRRVFVEVGPHPVLGFGVNETIEAALDDPGEATVLGTLRRDEGSAERFALSLAAAHTAGAKLDWEAFFAGTGAKRVPLPTYPFQRERYWLSQGSGPTDASSIGQREVEHPFLAAAIEDPDGERLTLTGRISLSTHPWLADHAVLGTVILPGTAFLELALRAGEEAGAETVEELTLLAPLVIPEQGAVALQVAVGTADDQGGRPISIHSRAEDGGEAGEWAINATGTLGAAAPAPPEPPESWPPAGAESLPVADLYDRLAERGFDYGPAFQGLTAAWRDGEEIYAEVSLPEDQRAGGFALHPALFDSTFLQATAPDQPAAPAVPFSWSGVALRAAGASSLRLALRQEGEGFSLLGMDETGATAIQVESLIARPIDHSQLQAAAGRRSLYSLQWPKRELEPAPDPLPAAAILGNREIEGLEAERHADLPALLEAIAGEGPVPETVVFDARSEAEPEDVPEASREVAQAALSLLQEWIAAEPLLDSRLIFLTEGAVAVEEGESPDLRAAPLWGLLRSAHSEHPGRFALIDTEGSNASSEALATAIAAAGEEPQLALREGEALTPRLAERPADPDHDEAPSFDPEKTILITGGLSGLGALFARHMAEAHGARRLLLVSRSGAKAEGAAELQAELAELGAEATVAACDVSDRKQLKKLLASIPDDRPLGAVIHSAGVLDDATIESMDSGQLDRVFSPKVDAAHHLHELTAGLDLSAFVVFSSAAGLLGVSGQANYAAANAFLDALAFRRRAAGLPATSLAWGGWDEASVLTRDLSAADQARLERVGFSRMPSDQVLGLFDAALAGGEPLLAPVALEMTGLRSQAAAGALAVVLRGLVRMPTRRERESSSLAAKLAGVAEGEREAVVLEQIRGEVATVLGYDSLEAIDPDRAFKELGFDSLGAVELRNRLAAATGLRLPTTLVFDHPTSAKLAGFLLETVSAGGGARQVVLAAQASEEPIAIVGMACRYPGGVSSPEQLWELVAEGGDAIDGFPTDRGWDLERLYDPDRETPGTCYARQGGFLADAGGFDARFFGIAPREALSIDPQQRLLLEASWQALENAEVDPSSLQGSSVGVFAGTSFQDYLPAFERGTAELEGYRLTGGSTSVISGRVAYSLGLEGPAITVDTACSSSLVAMHLAAQALRGGECTLALAGGVTVLASPGVFVEFSRQGGLAPDGRCKSFADGADGTGFAEGVGILALERLSDARRNGHPVLAVLKGSAVNQDGASNGLTAPNGPSQERVIRQALANARLEPKDVDAVEAHGTGTTLGDPIEAGALLATYGQDREEPLRLGSIKSNIGHTQAAAGVAGVIKMVQAMRHGALPRTLHVDQPSGKVDWETGKVELLAEKAPWQPNGHPRRAGVSSFGISGTNAHVILEEAPAPEGIESGEDRGVPEAPLGRAVALPLSAKSEPALREVAANLASHFEGNPDLDPADVAFSLATTRALFERRAVIVGSDPNELLGGLRAIAKGEQSPNAVEGKQRSGKLAYLLTGQGAQRAGMGEELYESSPAFAEALDGACAALDPHLSRPLKELLFARGGSPEAELLNETTFTQPALFAIEIALYRVLEQLGMAPDCLTGHSVGEIAAAHLAGALSLPDAAKLVAARARLMGELPKGGAMVAIEATEAEVTRALEGKEAELSIAAINSPTSIVISGQEKAAEQVQARFEEQGKRTKRLAVSHAFHSPLMEPMLEEFAQVAQSLEYGEPRIPIVSNLTGEILTPEQAADPAYWVSHVREAVRFAEGVETLAGQGVTTFVELGPDAVLTAMAASCLPEGSEVALIPTLREGRDEAGALIAALAAAHVAGARLDWTRLHPGAKRVPLPTYPFQRERYWLTAGARAGDLGAAGLGEADHPLLGAAIELPGEDGWLLTGRISLATHPWLADHAVLETVILPGTAFVELALKAGAEAGAAVVEELTLQAPLVLPETGAVLLQVSVGAADERGGRAISIHSRAEIHEEAEEWTLHATGLLGLEAPAAPESLGVWPPEGAEPIAAADVYARVAEHGFDYGPAFQGLTAAWRDGEEIYAEVSLDAARREEAGRFAIHPALLDAAFHAGLDAALAEAEGHEPNLPFAWQGISVRAAGAVTLRARLRRAGDRVSLDLADADDAPVAQVGSLRNRPISAEQMQGVHAGRQELFELAWREVDEPEAGDSPEATLLDTGEWGVEGDPIEASHAIAAKALERIQAHLARAEESSRLVFLAEGALAVGEAEAPSLAVATLAGLLRSAQAEHPGRFGLIDTDGSDASLRMLDGALAATAEDPLLALREGALLAPRLSEVEADAREADEAPSFDPEKTILITGGLSGLGALFARHMAEAHGARRLLLVSRSGAKAAGAAELQAELAELGAEVTVAACDVSDRKQLKKLLASIPDDRPLGAVIHAAGVIDDGLVEALGPERLDRVLAPKADAAWHLHELTAGADLEAFVLFSSIAASFGSPGQANYAAANSFLDALAFRRRAEGLPATAIAWGLWQRESGMTAGLGQADLARVRRSGIAQISDEHGLRLFDAAVRAAPAQTLALALNRAHLRARAAAGDLAPLFSGLVDSGGRRRAGLGSLATKLAAQPESERQGAVLEAVRAEVAAVLGHGSAGAIDPELAFKDLGFDSLAAVELRNRLAATTGLSLQPTIVFDYPSPAALAGHLLVELSAGGAVRQTAVKAQASEEPIAIVGMACRYPGEVGSPEGLWRLVEGERDGISEFPANRGWDVGRLYDPDREAGAARATSYTREGGFLHDSGEFDADFFAIGPREAVETDPQQRLLLETSWQALEDAGIDPRGLAQTQTGVFAGVMYQDYGEAPGMSQSLVSGRVAYTLGLEGPAITVDTACSSSLVAMHWAAQALRSGECSLALAGGVTVLATPYVFVEFSRQRGLAPDGRSKSFADSADGVSWGEGVGVLALERLSDAKRNGHEILAVIKGSAVNQDGASNGLTAPNGPSQERVIRQALANARLEPKDVDAVEAHGTGTTLGDPIEAGALLATYGQDREEPLRLGSIKSNIGHTQAAAGVAGVIKMVQAMRHGVLPRTLHVDAPSSKVDWEAGEIELLTEPIEWQPNGKPRRAGISSFGISGTNAHVILEEAPAAKTRAEVQEKPPAPLGQALALPLSAKSDPALREAAKRLAIHLAENPELDPADVGFSLARTRALFERRAVVTGSDRDQLLGGLRAIAEGEPSPNAIDGRARSGKLAYLLTGQGAQRAGMGKELHESSPVFAKALDEACEALDQHLSRPLKELLFAKEGSKKAELLDDTTFTQPALFAIEVALFRTLEALGMKPDYLTGHSVGEIAAAHICGVLSLPDAARLITARASLMGELPKGGAMVAIEATEAEVTEALEGKEAELSIAAINGPTSIVISGQEKQALEVQSHFEAQGKRTKRLTVSHAFHSPLIEPMLEDFAKVAGELAYREPKIPIVSNLSGEILAPEQATDPAYWVSHARGAVRFAAGIEALVAQGVTTFVELGPDPVLSAMAAPCLPEGSEATLIPTLREGRDETQAIAGALAAAHVAGAKLDWAKLSPGAKRVSLPTYPFQRERYWLSASATSGDLGAAGQKDADHPLLVAAIEDPEGERLTLTGRISLSTHPWLADHAVLGTVILPGTAFLELALRAGELTGAQTVSELTLQAPLLLAEQGAAQIQLAVSAPGEQGARPISIHSRAEEQGEAGEWVLNATGVLSTEAPEAPEPMIAWPPEEAEQIETDDLYERLAEIGFDYGPAFQGLKAAWQEGEAIYAEVSLPEERREEAGRYGIHPALLDAAFHAALGIALEGEGKPAVPFDWRGVRVPGPGPSSLRVQLGVQGDRLRLIAADPSGTPVVEVGSVLGRPVEQSQLASAGRQGSLYRLERQELSLPEPSEEATTLVDTREWESVEHPVEASHAIAAKALELIQAHLADEEAAQTRMVFLTEGAIDTGEAEPSLPAATLAGLLRSAHSEHPGRFALIDTDGSEASSEVIERAIAASATEPQLALREGGALAARLAEAKSEASEGGGEPVEETRALDPEETILITGATGALGALFARHLAQRGAGNLLLVSRSGEKARGAKELKAELEELGARATIAACDVSDRGQLKKLLGGLPSEHPLGAVVHAAGVFDNGLIPDLDQERLSRVMSPKADAAWYLHELTTDLDLSHFVLFSSAAGLLGGPGQGNYAAANSFLDALAAKRRLKGLPATSLAWGLWEQAGGIDAEQEQVLRQTRTLLGFTPIPTEQGLGLFEQAASLPDSLLAPVRFDRAALRAQAKAGSLPTPMRGLVRVPKGRGPAGDSLAIRLGSLPEAEREPFVLDMVRGHVAAVLGHDSAAAVDPARAFKDLGFDSLAAVELRNRLVAATQVSLQATAVFDYPTSSALAWHLLQTVVPAEGDGAALDPEEQEIRQAVASIPLARLRQSGLVDQLMRLAHLDEDVALETEADDDLIDSMDVEELVRRGAVGASPDREATQ